MPHYVALMSARACVIIPPVCYEREIDANAVVLYEDEQGGGGGGLDLLRQQERAREQVSISLSCDACV